MTNEPTMLLTLDEITCIVYDKIGSHEYLGGLHGCRFDIFEDIFRGFCVEKVEEI